MVHWSVGGLSGRSGLLPHHPTHAHKPPPLPSSTPHPRLLPDTHTTQPTPRQAPDKPTYVDIDFEKGDPVAIDGVKMSPATILTKLNELGGNNGIGRVDIVESRFVGG